MQKGYVEGDPAICNLQKEIPQSQIWKGSFREKSKTFKKNGHKNKIVLFRVKTFGVKKFGHGSISK